MARTSSEHKSFKRGGDNGVGFTRKEKRAEDPPVLESDAVLLKTLLGQTGITKGEALNIPSVRSCINFVADTVSMLPIKLYKEYDGKTDEVADDTRVRILNDDTGDTLDAVQFWRAVISDYYLGKGGYAYIRKNLNKFTGLHYTDETHVSTVKNADPIFKDYDILVDGKPYKPYEFLKILRNTKDGAEGVSIVEENRLILSVAYNTMVFEENLVKKGGNKKGFVKSAKKADPGSHRRIKRSVEKLV